MPIDLPRLNSHLSQVANGSSVWIVGFTQHGSIKKLIGMGLAPGMQLEVINIQPNGSVIVAMGEQRTGLGAEIADTILVSDRLPNHSEKQEDNMTAPTKTHLQDMTAGTIGKIIGYEQTMAGYKGKLLSMGVTPKTQFTVVRVAPLGDPVEIQVRGFHLSLRKDEADALVVEVVK